MPDPELPNGKLAAGLLEELLDAGPELPPEVLLGPRVGEDACVIETGAGVLVAATDPITMTGNRVGGHAVLINANDVAVTGVQPRYFLASVLFPERTRESQVRALFADMRSALSRVGAALVGGRPRHFAGDRAPRSRRRDEQAVPPHLRSPLLQSRRRRRSQCHRRGRQRSRR